MKNSLANKIVMRLLTGQVNYKIQGCCVQYTAPSVLLIQDAEDFYQEVFSQNRFEEWLRQDEIFGVLVDRKIWSEAHQQKLDDLPHKIDSLKLDYYKSYLMGQDLKKVEKDLRFYKMLYSKMTAQRYCLDQYTLESYAAVQKNTYLIKKCISVDGENFKPKHEHLLNKIILCISKDSVSNQDLRWLSHNDPWTTHWSMSKEKVFGKDSLDLNEDQRTIISYSKMYDIAYSSSERPANSVIDNDDMFDGWLLYQREELDKRITENKINKRMGSKTSNAKNVLIPVNNEEEAKEIYSMNNEKNMAAVRRSLSSGKL